MSNRILVNPGTPQEWEMTLKPGVNRIGRGEQNDFTINHPSVSTSHCEINVSDAGVFLKDLGSSNGTFVNRAPVQEGWLQPGQHVQFGAIDTVFECDARAPVSPAVGQAAPGATVVVAAVGAAPNIQPPGTTGLRLSRSEPAATPEPDTSPPPARMTGHHGKAPVHLVAEREALNKRRFLLGSVGAVLGGLLGMGVWYVLIVATKSSFGIVAWGVGVATGFGARLLSRQGSMGLGVMAATCALLAILAGEYLAIRALVEKEGRRFARLAYIGQMAYAQAAIKAETPEQIRELLAKENEKQPAEITGEEIKAFQEVELPELREFAQGKPSREEFAEKLGHEFAAEFDYYEYFFKEDVKAGVFMVLFAVLGIATAYKIASGEEDKS